MDVSAIQQAIHESGLDGWLLYDFHGLNPIARQIAGLQGIVTRRWFLFIPQSGEPQAIMHTMERIAFAGVPGRHHYYLSWQELDDALRRVLAGHHRIAMEYSPDNAIPYVARVDAGTLEKVRALGADVVSSADLIAQFLARWSPAQVASHREAATALLEIKDKAFRFIADGLRAGQGINEFDVCEFMRGEFRRRGMVTDDGPICAVGPNSGNPHYEPTAQQAASITSGQLVLLDLWTRTDTADSVYADITWVGYTAASVPAKVSSVFEVVARARDRATAFINKRLAQGRTVFGYEVDRAVRQIISDAGYADRFIHRTGHSIGVDVHSVGPNIDDLETQDRRRLQDGMAFSIEPGIYLPEFGVRSEIDVLMADGHATITTLPLQTEVLALL